MGIIAKFRRLPDADLMRLKSNPDWVAKYLRLTEPPESFGPLTDLVIEQTWHAIHFLLTGSARGGGAPMNFIAVGGAELGEDLGQGPARSFRAEDVAHLAEVLTELPVAALDERFDPAALGAADIYPGVWSQSEAEGDLRSGGDLRDEVTHSYEQLRGFILDAASGHEALLVSLT